MNERDAKTLAIRAADGELDAAGRARLEEYCHAHPEFRAFVDAEHETARLATGFCKDLHLRAPLRVRRRRGRLVMVAAATAAVLVAMLLVLLEHEEPGARSEVEGATATFLTLRGDDPSRLARGAYAAGKGRYRVDVVRHTLLQTGAGAVQLAPGSYTVDIDSGQVRVEAERGEAVLENVEGAEQVKAGGSAVLRAVASASLAAAAVPASPQTGPPAHVTGTVVDGEGRPLEGARIWVSDAQDPAVGRVVTETGPDGAFTVEELRGALRYLGARAPGKAPSDLRLLRWKQAEELTVAIRLAAKGGALRGRLTPPIAGAKVLLGRSFRNMPFRARSEDGYTLTAVRARAMTTDASGTFEANDLPPQWNELRVYAAGYAPHRDFLRLPPGGLLEYEVELQTSAAVFGAVRDERGAPVEGAQIRYRWRYAAHGPESPVATTGAGGRFQLGGVPAGSLEFEVDAGERGQAHAHLVTKTGRELEWNPVVTSGLDLAGRVLYEDGEPAAGAHVWCYAAVASSPGYRAEATADKDGAFRIEKRRRVVHDLRVWHDKDGRMWGRAPAVVVRIAPEDLPVTIRLSRRPADWAPGSARGRVLLPDGSPAARTSVKMHPLVRPWGAGVAVTAKDGTFAIEDLDPGPYSVEIHLDGQGTLHLQKVEVEQGRALEMGDIRFRAAGRVRVRLLDFAGDPIRGKAYCSVTDLDRRVFFTVDQTGPATALSEDLTPGRYLVWTGAIGLYREVTVPEGGEVEVEVQLRKPYQVIVDLSYADGTKPKLVDIAMTDATGRVVFRMRDANTKEGAIAYHFVPGTYRLAFADVRGRKGAVDVTVAPSGEPLRTQAVLRE